MNKEKLLKTFGNNLKAERNRLGYSQEKLAELAGLSYGQIISLIEKGKMNTSLYVIISLLNALNIDFDKLINRKNF